ncbi:MAG: TonB-dependent receptor [Opitutaceae bacterium]|nr:TonB-dependent receptor [Opitutaceae bacterium]
MKSHRLFLITAVAATVFSAAIPLPLFAQAAPATPPTAGAKEDVVKLEAFSVTGTNIKRLDQEKVLPVTVFNLDHIEARNALTPVEMLTALPQVTNLPLNESQNGGANSRGDNANVNLRGIGAGNTLVLLNGRRLAPHPVTSNDAGVPAFYTNVNQLPTQGIERIDVLRDGASAIYGSDAVAGVINYISRRDLRGTELRTRFGVPEHGEGRNYQVTLTTGREFARGKGRVLATFDFLQRDEIPYRSRSFSANGNRTARAPAGFNALGGQFDDRSVVSIYPSFRIGAATATNYFRPVNGTLAFTNVNPTANRAANPESFTNLNQYQNTGQSKSDRKNFFTHIEYDLSDRITAFGDFSVYHSTSHLQRQPVQINGPSADQVAPVSVDNPYNPYGSRFYHPTGAPNADGTPRLTGTPQGITLLSLLLEELGAESVEVNSGVYRGVAGLRGKIGNDWTWESAAVYTRAYTADVSNNAARESLFQRAVMRTDATAFNPFYHTFRVANGAVVPDRPYTNPKSVLDTFSQKWRHDGFSAITSADTRVAGPLFRYWDNTVSLAGGVEYRKEQYLDTRPAYVGSNPPGVGLNVDDNDYLVASYAPNSTGNRVVYSGYLETIIPVVAPRRNLPLVHSLELSGSARHENYSDFGTTTRPKAGVNWKPTAGLMIRGSFNQGFSAPNLPTLYAPTRFIVDSAPGSNDAYRAQTVGNGTYVMKRYSTGNLALKPVTATGKSVGLALEVPKIKGLSLTADYWQVDQSNVIGSYSDAQLVNSDAAKLNAYTQSQLAAGRTIAQIDLGSGTASYKGDPGIKRLAPTPAEIAEFAAFNATRPAAQQAAVVGRIDSRNIQFQNLAKGYASGVDLSLNYVLPNLPIGRFTLNADWSYMIRTYQLRDVPGAAPLFIERLNVDGTTRWRGTTAVNWRKGNWNANLGAYYTGRFADTATVTAANYTALGSPRYISRQFDSGTYLYRYVVRDVVSFNASVGYRFKQEAGRVLRNTSIRLGVINLTDREPPHTSDQIGYSAGVHGSLFQGRAWTLELTKQL